MLKNKFSLFILFNGFVIIFCNLKHFGQFFTSWIISGLFGHPAMRKVNKWSAQIPFEIQHVLIIYFSQASMVKPRAYFFLMMKWDITRSVLWRSCCKHFQEKHWDLLLLHRLRLRHTSWNVCLLFTPLPLSSAIIATLSALLWDYLTSYCGDLTFNIRKTKLYLYF